VVIEPSLLTGDASCPACGGLLWFFSTSGGERVVFELDAALPLRERWRIILAGKLGVSPSKIPDNVRFDDLGLSSLERVELVMAVEEEWKA